MKTTTDTFKAIAELDLTRIITKIMDPEDGEGWSLEKAISVQKEYRRFLCVMKAFPDADTSPQIDVDTFWHYHIMDTRKYAADCQAAFGYFLHHCPHLSLHGDEGEMVHEECGARMRELYEQLFDEPYGAELNAYCGVNRDPAQARSAYCGVNRDPIQARTAYCGVNRDPIQVRSAYCGVNRDPIQLRSAYCGVNRDPIQVRSAYCGVNRDPIVPADAASPRAGAQLAPAGIALRSAYELARTPGTSRVSATAH